MKIWKRISTILLSFAFLCVLASCGSQPDNAESSPSPAGSSVKSQAPIEEVKEPETSDLTTGQKNALEKAKAYLGISAFSHDGLIEQLEFEQFEHEEAVFAADNCEADWNEQAMKKAEAYLQTSAFSYSGLIEQLEYEKFTTEQATYGVDNCGADWNEQAAKKAKSYISISSFSMDGLISQLEYEGFTHDQAVYGVEQNGY